MQSMEHSTLLEELKNLVDPWEIRCLVLLSLFLQIVLIFSGDLRKRNASQLLIFVLWLAYLLADSVAIFALGVLAHSQYKSFPSSAAENLGLRAFWSPFLILHLGGPDTITAFSLEDNQLWRRHLLNLVFQVATAVYVLIKSLSLNTRTTWLLPIISLFMFVTGLLKYGERTWALFSASTDCVLKFSLTRPKLSPLYSVPIGSRSLDLSRPLSVTPEMIVQSAYDFFLFYRGRLFDLVVGYPKVSGGLYKDVIKLVEIQLSFMYDMLYTKSGVIHTCTGRLIRLTTFIFSIITLLLFFLLEKSRYNPTDVRITYILAIGAVVLELYAMFSAIVSFWTYNWLLNRKYTTLASLVFRLSNIFGLYSKTGWSDSMTGYNFFTLCYYDSQSSVTRCNIMRSIGFKDKWDHFWYTEHKQVPQVLKEAIYKLLRKKQDKLPRVHRSNHYYGLWALDMQNYSDELGWSTERSLDECILVWHIATDLCFYNSTENDTNDALRLYEKDINISRLVSDYLLFILLKGPFLLPHPKEDSDEASPLDLVHMYESTFLDLRYRRMGRSKSIKDIPKMLLSGTWEPESNSVLFHACRLARELLKIEDKTRRWELISLVWLDILHFTAVKSRGSLHAKQLSYGGELLTHVWILSLNMGVS